jgi:hypothetical protein
MIELTNGIMFSSLLRGQKLKRRKSTCDNIPFTIQETSKKNSPDKMIAWYEHKIVYIVELIIDFVRQIQ